METLRHGGHVDSCALDIGGDFLSDDGSESTLPSSPTESSLGDVLSSPRSYLHPQCPMDSFWAWNSLSHYTDGESFGFVCPSLEAPYCFPYVRCNVVNVVHGDPTLYTLEIIVGKRSVRKEARFRAWRELYESVRYVVGDRATIPKFPHRYRIASLSPRVRASPEFLMRRVHDLANFFRELIVSLISTHVKSPWDLFSSIGIPPEILEDLRALNRPTEDWNLNQMYEYSQEYMKHVNFSFKSLLCHQDTPGDEGDDHKSLSSFGVCPSLLFDCRTRFLVPCGAFMSSQESSKVYLSLGGQSRCVFHVRALRSTLHRETGCHLGLFTHHDGEPVMFLRLDVENRKVKLYRFGVCASPGNASNGVKLLHDSTLVLGSDSRGSFTTTCSNGLDVLSTGHQGTTTTTTTTKHTGHREGDDEESAWTYALEVKKPESTYRIKAATISWPCPAPERPSSAASLNGGGSHAPRDCGGAVVEVWVEQFYDAVQMISLVVARSIMFHAGQRAAKPLSHACAPPTHVQHSAIASCKELSFLWSAEQHQAGDETSMPMTHHHRGDHTSLDSSQTRVEGAGARGAGDMGYLLCAAGTGNNSRLPFM